MNLLAFNDLVQRFASAARASSSTVLDFTIGSILRALAEAHAAVALWLQWLILIVLRQSRLSTSLGGEVDSFVADFGMTRLPGIGSVGSITFSRYTPTLAAFIPLGATVKTSDGSQQFTVIADATNTAYSAALGGYTSPANTASLTVKAQASSAGTASNVQAGTITILASAIAGVDTVNNALAFVGGFDAESDAALKTRFALFIQGLSKATTAAIGSAVMGVQQGLTYAIAVAVDTQNNPSPGNFVVTVDDGSGNPAQTILDAVYTAVDAVRAVGATFSVRGPIVSNVTVSMSITAAPGYQKVNLQGPVALAVTAFIDGLGIGEDLLYTQLAKTAWDATAGVASVTGLLVNGSQADVSAGVSGVIRATSVAVN